MSCQVNWKIFCQEINFKTSSESERVHNDQIAQADLGKHFLEISRREPCTVVSTRSHVRLQPPTSQTFHVLHSDIFGATSITNHRTKHRSNSL